jgi:hypothetical protein
MVTAQELETCLTNTLKQLQRPGISDQQKILLVGIISTLRWVDGSGGPVIEAIYQGIGIDPGVTVNISGWPS